MNALDNLTNLYHNVCAWINHSIFMINEIEDFMNELLVSIND